MKEKMKKREKKNETKKNEGVCCKKEGKASLPEENNQYIPSSHVMCLILQKFPNIFLFVIKRHTQNEMKEIKFQLVQSPHTDDTSHGCNGSDSKSISLMTNRANHLL